MPRSAHPAANQYKRGSAESAEYHEAFLRAPEEVHFTFAVYRIHNKKPSSE